MRRPFVLWLIMVFTSLSSGCASTPSSDFILIDKYLNAWDQFSQGDKSVIPLLKGEQKSFEQNLTDALLMNDNRAPGRLVFYAVVQVGGFIPLPSPLGKAFHQHVGNAVPIFTRKKDGSESFFAGDLYFWWEAHKAEYASFPLYEAWRQRDFAQNVAIRMYQRTSKTRK